MINNKVQALTQLAGTDIKKGFNWEEHEKV